MPSIDVVRERIRHHAGQEFPTITGRPFTYEVPGNYVRVDRTDRTDRTDRNLS